MFELQDRWNSNWRQIDTTSPYTFSLNTAAFREWPSYSHRVGLGRLNNTGTSNPVSVFFSNSNPGNPAQFGMWSGTIPVSIVSVHSALLPDGKIFMSDGQSAGADAIVWDPATYNSASVTAPANIFCNGMEQMADGRILSWEGTREATLGLPLPEYSIRVAIRGRAFRIWHIRVGTRPQRCSQTVASL